MRKNNNNNLPITREDVVRIVTDIVARSQAELALMLGKALKDLEHRLEDKISSLEKKVVRMGEELGAKINGLNTRIDKLAFETVKYTDHKLLTDRVDKLERTIQKKR